MSESSPEPATFKGLGEPDSPGYGRQSSKPTQVQEEASELIELMRKTQVLETIALRRRAARAAEAALDQGADEVRIFRDGTVWKRHRDEWARIDPRVGGAVCWSPTIMGPD
jgi:hypothetical protein